MRIQFDAIWEIDKDNGISNRVPLRVNGITAYGGALKHYKRYY